MSDRKIGAWEWERLFLSNPIAILAILTISFILDNNRVGEQPCILWQVMSNNSRRKRMPLFPNLAINSWLWVNGQRTRILIVIRKIHDILEGAALSVAIIYLSVTKGKIHNVIYLTWRDWTGGAGQPAKQVGLVDNSIWSEELNWSIVRAARQ